MDSTTKSYNMSHTSAALELLRIMNIEKTLTQSLDIMLAAQLGNEPELKPYADVMYTFFAKYMSWQHLKEKFATIYANEFTEGELQAMIEFYKTDVGKKAIEKLPILTVKGTEIGQQAIQEHIQELTEAIQNRAKEFEKI